MSNDVIISVEHLSKRYKLGQIGATTLRDSVERLWHRVRGRDPAEEMGKIGQRVAKLSGSQVAELPSRQIVGETQVSSDFNLTTKQHKNLTTDQGSTTQQPNNVTTATNRDSELWALRDVSFEVRRGEVLGIIGRNGAGKSTLLKILSRITEPTSGRAVIRGRVGSLLEVGTGFHPELTGRENIYLNGAILGMRKAEITKKFDEIVAFAEVERFIDTPVKRYSSGMYVRLAFAVAAHLDPEILLVDEVLAVGDASFQRKCLGKMSDVAEQGRTILFVSHNMTAITSLCSRAIVLEFGRLMFDGAAQAGVDGYIHSGMSRQACLLSKRKDRTGDGSVRLVSLNIENADRSETIRTTSCLRVTIGYESDTPLKRAHFLVGVYSPSNVGIFALNSDAAGGLPELLPATGTVTCLTDPVNLTAGRCIVNLAVLKGGSMADYVQHAGHFDIEDEDVYGSGKLPTRDWVMCVIRHRWAAEEGV